MILLLLIRALMAAVPLLPPSNDECSNATIISGEGEFPFVNLNATITEPVDQCFDYPYHGSPVIQSDVWYCWTATCTGPVTIDTCGSTAADTRIAVHMGCDCANAIYLNCSDNDCADQTMLQFHAQTNQQYLIQIGSWPAHSADSDTFRIACREYPDYKEGPYFLCNHNNNPAVYGPICKSRSGWDALSSTYDEFIVVDDFVPEEQGGINQACWAGVYMADGQECIRYEPDDFVISYYTDDCGWPGELLAGPFSQAAGTLDVDPPIMTNVELPGGVQEFEFGATHGLVKVNAGQTYWVTIANSNSDGCGWYWETAPGDGYALQFDEFNQSASVVKNNLSFCFDVNRDVAPICSSATIAHDYCETAIPLVDAITQFDTFLATTDDPAEHPPLCVSFGYPPEEVPSGIFPLGDEQLHNDIWFELDNPCSGRVRFSTCESSFDTKLAVYLGASCINAYAIACSDDACGFENLASLVEVDLYDGLDYKVNVGGFEGRWGTGVLTFQYIVPEHPTLLEYAALARCFNGACGQGCRSESMYNCCLTQDFDADNDVDLLDANQLIQSISNPK